MSSRVDGWVGHLQPLRPPNPPPPGSLSTLLVHPALARIFRGPLSDLPQPLDVQRERLVKELVWRRGRAHAREVHIAAAVLRASGTT